MEALCARWAKLSKNSPRVADLGFFPAARATPLILRLCRCFVDVWSPSLLKQEALNGSVTPAAGKNPSLPGKTPVCREKPEKPELQAGGYAPRTPISSRPLARPPGGAEGSTNIISD